MARIIEAPARAASWIAATPTPDGGMLLELDGPPEPVKPQASGPDANLAVDMDEPRLQISPWLLGALAALREAGKARADQFLGGIDGEQEAVAEIKKGGSTASRLLTPPSAPRGELSDAEKTLVLWNKHNPDKAWAPAPPNNVLTYKEKHGDTPAVKVELNKEAYHYLQVRSATLARNMLKGRKFAADDAGIDAIKRVYSDARNQARDELARRPVERIGTVK